MMVRMSDKLRAQISQALSKHYEDVLAVAKGKIPNLEDPRVKNHVANFLAPYQPILAQLPAEFTNTDTGVAVKIVGHPAANAGYGGMRVGLPSEMYTPPGYSGHLKIEWESLPLDYREEFLAAFAHFKDIHAKSETLRRGVQDLLVKCTTVQQALKAWPTLREYLPRDVVIKLDEPETRGRKKGSKNDVIEVDDNLDALVALPILIKDV